MQKPFVSPAGERAPTFTRWYLSVVALAAVALGSAVGQVPNRSSDEPSRLCPTAEATDTAEHDLALHHQSSVLNAALSSGSALWKFVIDPSTAYPERVAAVSQGASLIPAEELPNLWKAYAELEVLPTGVNPSPCEFVWPNAWTARSPETWALRRAKPIPGVVSVKAETRTILGFRVDLPLQAIDYPLDVRGRNYTPWLWQVQRAITILADGVLHVYSQPDRYPELAEVALRWHSANFYEQRIRLRFLHGGPRNPVWFETMIKLAFQGEDGAGSLTVYAGYSAHIKDLAHTAQIVILQRAGNAHVALEAADGVAGMARKVVSLPPESQPSPTATSILAIASWAMNHDLEDPTRDLFAWELCRAMDQPACRASLRSGSVAELEAWFAAERPPLEQQAVAEVPKLRELAAELHQRIE